MLAAGDSAVAYMVANAQESILDAWTALEVLSPPTFRQPEDLAGGDRGAVAWLEGTAKKEAVLSDRARHR